MTSATGTARTAEIAGYAAAVRAALADVPADRSEELLDDLEEHLAEVAADDEAPLEFRLGSPAAYADELRSAAGLPAGPAERRAGALAGGAELVARLRAWGPVRQVEEFLPELRPAWWVLRAWAAVTAVDVVFVGGTSFPVPTLGLGPVGFVVTAAAVAWSVRLGLRARAEGRAPGRAAIVLNAGLGLLALIALVGLADRTGVASAEPVYYDDGAPDTLVHEDGTPITNVLPYSSTGEPLTGVLLYDQDGRPIDDLADWTVDGELVETVPGSPVQPGNAFPQQRQVHTYDDQGRPVVVPVPEAPATPTP
ncbi:HAAS signaling domain-containing protein [Modestobacter versicolor]|uniref:HAAS signaling domain-containing protein n=1 Tax=Modestobacter versicolor TaxID=429133 RepID=UPI0034DF2B44